MAGGQRLHAKLCNLRASYCKVTSCIRVGCMLPSWLRTRGGSTPSFIAAGLTEEGKGSLGAVRTSAVLKYRIVKVHTLAVQKFTGLKFRSSYFREIGMGAKGTKICTMRKFPTIWYVHTRSTSCTCRRSIYHYTLSYNRPYLCALHLTHYFSGPSLLKVANIGRLYDLGTRLVQHL